MIRSRGPRPITASGASSLLLIGLTSWGCRDGGRGQPTVVRTDSAGVAITLTADAPLVFAEVNSLPALSIGGADAVGPTQFFGVQGIHVDASGRLWVADAQSGELRIFGPDGAHWKTRGGRGDGPGEFVRIRLLGAGPEDSVFVADGGIDRVTVLDPEGEFVRTVRLPAAGRPAPRPFALFPDGSLLGRMPRIVAASSVEPGRILRDSVELVRTKLGQPAVEPIGAARGPLWLWTGTSQVPVPFTVNASFAVAGDDVHLVSGSSFRVRVLRGGEVREVYGVDREPRTVTPHHVGSYRAFVEEYVPERSRAEHLSALDHELLPDLLPAYDRALVSTDGYVWAQVHEPDRLGPHDWDVFGPERRFLGQVRVRAGFYPMLVTADALIGVWRDVTGVEHVRVYGMITQH